MKNVRFNAWLFVLMALGYLGAFSTAPHVIGALAFMTVAFAVGAKRPAWGLSPAALLFLATSLTAAVALAVWATRSPEWIEMGLFCHAGLAFVAGPRARRVGEGVLLLSAAAFFIVSGGLVRSPHLLLTVPAVLVAATGALLALAFPHRRAPMGRMIADHAALLAGLSMVAFMLSPLPTAAVRGISSWMGRPLGSSRDASDPLRDDLDLWTLRPIDINDVTHYKSQPKPVMRVVVESGRENLPKWPLPVLYLRAGVLDTHLRGRWDTFARPEPRACGADGWVRFQASDPRPVNLVCAVTMLGHPTRALWTAAEPLAIEAGEIEIDLHDGARLPWQAGKQSQYRFASCVRGAPAEAPPAAGEPIDTQAPPDYAALARRGRELKGDATGAMEVARRIVEDLDATCEYQMYPPPPPAGREPIVDFYERGRLGNCCHFAAAALAMLRGAGVPCRLVTGFMTDEWDEKTNAFTVRARDLHAWLEIQVADIGWVTVDPTPPMHFADGKTIVMPPKNQGERERFIDVATGHEVISVPGGGGVPGPSMVDRARTYAGNLSVPEVPWIGTALALVVLAAIVLTPAVKQAVERRAGRTAPKTKARSPIAFLNEFLLILKYAGHAPAPQETIPRFAGRLPRACPRPAVESIVRLYHAARFGGTALTDEERGAIREALHALRLSLRRQ